MIPILWNHDSKRVIGHVDATGRELFGKVTEAFCVGSTSARQICQRHGYDPDAMVRRA